MTPVILDFDGSVGPLPDERRIPLASWQEKIRFGCTHATLRELRGTLDEIAWCEGPVFTGSGDFHHVSLALIERLSRETSVDVVVFDNHPDNMRYVFGVHCGSWVRRVTQLRCVRHVHVLGITSSDVAASRAWQNYLAPLYRGKLTYWCIGTQTGWTAHAGLTRRVREFASAEALIDAFQSSQRDSAHPLYLSIDKDVLGETVVHTNWDQGVMTLEDLFRAIAPLQHRMVAADVTGEISDYRYRSLLKRALSAVDRQARVDDARVREARIEHDRINLQLAAFLSRSLMPRSPAIATRLQEADARLS